MARSTYRPGDHVRLRHCVGDWVLQGRAEAPRAWFVEPYDRVALMLTVPMVQAQADYRYFTFTKPDGRVYALQVPSSDLERVW